MHRPLREDDLLPSGRLSRLGSRVLLFAEVDSTNAYLLEHAETLPDGAIAVAEYQRAGRGRLGRTWSAPRGASVLMSVLLREHEGSRLLSSATLLAAVAICEAIEASTDCRPALRWPNDVTIDGRKVAGVLAETRRLGLSAVAGSAVGKEAAPTTWRALVIGIGLNCLQQSGHFGDDLAGKATSLDLASRHAVERAAVARALVSALDERVRGAPRDEGELHTATLRYWGDLGSSVVLREGEREYRGTIVDLGPDGELEVELEGGGRRRFVAATTTRLW